MRGGNLSISQHPLIPQYWGLTSTFLNIKTQICVLTLPLHISFKVMFCHVLNGGFRRSLRLGTSTIVNIPI